jgi:hypothetical protein
MPFKPTARRRTCIGRRFATLRDVVDHYNDLLKLALTERDKAERL